MACEPRDIWLAIEQVQLTRTQDGAESADSIRIKFKDDLSDTKSWWTLKSTSKPAKAFDRILKALDGSATVLARIAPATDRELICDAFRIVSKDPRQGLQHS